MNKPDDSKLKRIAIILASGDGRRFNKQLPKQFTSLKGLSILERTILAFENHKKIHEIIIVVNPLFINETKQILSGNDFKKVKDVIAGGKNRKESSYIGIHAIEDDEAIVLIHDASRPLVSKEIISECVKSLKSVNAVAVAVPVSDTIYKIDDNAIIQEVPDRKFYLQAQTPQGFKISLIRKAHKMAMDDSSTDFSDDCSLVLKYKLDQIAWVNGDEKNIKITYPIDKEIAKVILKKKNL